ncbi:MAG: hypothetical protein NC394_08080 [Bacteroides sp.]|nr:hypothetical protein [Bacteroides sp.]
MTDERITNAINGIEPDLDAKQRMYDNIIEKAESRTKTVGALRIVKPLASAAACICLVAAAALIFSLGAVNFDNTVSGGASGNADNGAIARDEAGFDITEPADANIAYGAEASEYAYGEQAFDAAMLEEIEAEPVEEAPAENTFEEALDERSANISEYGVFNLPVGAEYWDTPKAESDQFEDEALQKEYEDLQNRLYYNGNSYSVTVLPVDWTAEEGSDDGAAIESTTLDWGVNAIMDRIDSGDEISFRITWSNGYYIYCLKNVYEVDEEEFIEFAKAAVEANGRQ